MLEAVTADADTAMKPLTSKQCERVQRKKKKLAAYLEIAKLNDKDREAKAMMLQRREESKCSDGDSSSGVFVPREGHGRKRYKKDRETAVQDVKLNGVSESSQDVSNPAVESPEPCCKFEPVSFCPNNLPPGFSDHALIGKSGKVRLAGEELAELKRELRERKNQLKCIPRFRLKEMGECASLTMKEEERTPLFLSDVQHLLMFSMLGHHSPYQPSRWCQLQKYNRISHTVVVLIEGLSLYDFQAHESLLPAIADIFVHRVEVITPLAYNGSLVEELAAVPLTGTQKHKLLNEFGSLEAAMKHKEDLFKVMRAIFPVIESSCTSDEASRPVSDHFSRTQLLLSAYQLIEENYPLPLKGKLRARYADFVFTKDLYHEVTHNSPMFSLDCEMCRTTSGELEVTRISVVNEQLEDHGHSDMLWWHTHHHHEGQRVYTEGWDATGEIKYPLVVYETLVKPRNRITDYLTQFSGITKELLADVDVRLEDVQKSIRALLPPDAILVGQSLNFDLIALKMMHPYIIDTSVIYNITGDRFRKTKLALLAQRFLGEEIQQGKKGHCSVEDSTTCMRLTQLKLANDIEYGDSVLACQRATIARQRQRNPTSTEQEVAASLFSHVTRLDKSAAVVGCSEVIDKYLNYMSETMFGISDSTESCSKNVQCVVTPNETVVSQTCNIVLEHSFVLAHVIANHTESDDKTVVMKQVNSWCRAVWEHIAYSGLYVMLFGGQKDGANGACFIQIKKPPVPNRA